LAVSIGDIAAAYPSANENIDRVWKMLAYVCRYGHQPITALLQMPVGNLRRLADKIADLIEKENTSGSSAFRSD